jgi:hypothetical protein
VIRTSGLSNVFKRKCNITLKVGKIPAAVSLAVSASPFEQAQQNGFFVARFLAAWGIPT